MSLSARIAGLLLLIPFWVLAAPAVPTGVNANLPGEYIDLTWNLSAGAYNYQVEYTETGVGTRTRDVGNTSLFQQNVVRGRTYQYRVKACDGSGCSGFSSTATVAVPLIPDTPSAPTTSLNGTTLSVSWGSMPRATWYQLEPFVNGVSQGVRKASSPFTQSGTAGSTYEYLLKACNLNLCSANSAASTAVTIPLPKPPAKQGAPRASLSGFTVSISWSAAATATYYYLEPYENGRATGGITLGNELSYSITGVGGANYQFLTKACNAHGCSAYSDASNVVTLATPARQGAPVASNSGQSITVNWSAASSATYYLLEPYKNDVPTGQLRLGDVRTYSFTGESGAKYQFLTKACNIYGCSPYSVESNVLNLPVAKYQVTTSAGAGGVISPTSVEVNAGATTVFNVTPNPGYQINQISGCGKTGTSSPFTTAPINAACQVTVSFKIAELVASPSISPNGGTHNGAVPVCLSTTTPGAEIRYSIDGSDVTTASKLYADCFSLESSATVKAKAFKSGMTDSTQNSAVFTVTPLKGPITKYGYDARGRLIHIDDDKGVSATYALDTAGNRMVVQDQTAPPLSPEITMLTFSSEEVTKPTEVTISWKAKNATACSLRLNRGNGEPEEISGSSSGNIKAIISSQTSVILTCVYREQKKSLAKIIKGPRL